jgi:hypothetical protein
MEVKMRRWIVFGLPVFIALLTFGNPVQSWGLQGQAQGQDQDQGQIQAQAQANTQVLEVNPDVDVDVDIYKKDINIEDINVAVAKSDLYGAVSGVPPIDNFIPEATNSAVPGSGLGVGILKICTGDNTVDGSISTTGISALSQNTGVNALNQQSFNVQANMTP